MYLLYSLVTGIVFVLASPYFFYQALRHNKYVGSIGQRLGYLPISFNLDGDESIWVHAVSVGEVLSARPLISELRARYPKLRLFLSTTTLTGQQLARRSVSDVDAVFYFPFDWAFTARRTLNVVKPRLFVMIETEIWPNLLRECRRRRHQDRDGQRPHLVPIVPAVSADPSLHPTGARRHRSFLRAGRRDGSRGSSISAPIRRGSRSPAV